MAEPASRQPLPLTLQKLLAEGDLPFKDFMEIALYDELSGYYARPDLRVGREGDFVTSPSLSPAFGYALARLAADFVARTGDALTAVVDIGCGDGKLIRSIENQVSDDVRERVRFFGVDRMIAPASERIRFTRSLDEIPFDLPVLILSNELFDAFPVARLVQRSEGLHELFVTLRDGELDWAERPAAGDFVDYFAHRGIKLQDGQFADVTPDWSAFYSDVCARLRRGLVVTIDYGFPQRQLFDVRIRRFGTAAAFHRQLFSRDLLARPGEQDLTAHINFDDLISAGEARGLSTLLFGRQASFLLALGITDHKLFRAADELQYAALEDAVAGSEQRQAARRLVLPDGIGEEMRVLVQGKGVAVEGWSFQRRLY